MTTIQERLQRKREPLDKWSTREQLCLAFAVARSGDQNWMYVSWALKPFGDPNRPADWFHQKNCAAQYGALLENVETPKRKKRTSGVETAIETPSESILRRLIAERKAELKRAMEEERQEYLRIQDEMKLLKSGNISEEQLDLMCKQIDEEEAAKEKEAIAHAQWLKERELRKQEIERAWRPMIKVNSPVPVPMGPKRKASDSIDSMIDMELEGRVTPTQQPVENKPALSPLLTSLLKSPSHAQNVVTSSILHTAITSQRPINSSTNPTIASLLNSSANVQVSAGLQQLVTSAIAQEPIKDTIADLLQVSDTLPNLKVEDIESTINQPLPEIKTEEVDVIISDLIENAEIVTDPEEHLLEGNNDIIADFENELEELVNKEKEVEEAANAEAAKQEQKPKEIDPFEFQEEPEVFEPKLTPVKQVQQVVEEEAPEEEQKEITEPEAIESPEVVENTPDETGVGSGSVEIVEVVEIEDEGIGKELNKSQIQDIVHSSIKTEEDQEENTSESNENEDVPVKTPESEPEVPPVVQNTADVVSETESLDLDLEIKSESEIKEENVDTEEDVSRRNTFTPEYSENIFDDMNIEVTKLNKPGKAKRDYSRTKKKEGSDFDILLAVEQAVSAGAEEEQFSDSDKKSDIVKKEKVENDRSNSPWLEEEEGVTLRSRKNYSTPATPIDSVPNSPASSSAYLDDDRDYKNWKKSIMLVYSRLSSHKYSSLFLKPISDDKAPGYHNIVKRPMDLSTIRKNIENGNIRTTDEFQRDVLLMFQNAIMYNKTGETVYKMALEMQKEGVTHITILLQAQNEAIPLRRETRTSDLPGNKRKRGQDDNSKNKKRKED